MKKTGFTIAEILISLVVVGVITGFAINIFRPFDKSYKYLYSNAYYSLDRALYNATMTYIPENEYNREPFQETARNAVTGQAITVTPQMGAQRLCRALTEYINTVSTNCNAAPSDSAGADGIFSTTPSFITNNGMRFWISRRYPDNGDNRTKFFVIYADLNGTKPPNSMRYEEGNGANQNRTRDPDVFAFAALPMGRVCPIGVPEVEPRYLTTRTKYIDENMEVAYSSDSQDQNFNSAFSLASQPMIYNMAQAWGYYISGDEADDNIPIPDAPLSYNGYIRSVIGNSAIYGFLNGRTMRSYFNNRYSGSRRPALNSAPPAEGNSGGFGCAEKSDNECEVIIDKYVY